MKTTKKTQDGHSMDETIETVLRQRLYSYQQTWMRDASRFKIGLWARQTGKDFTCAAEAVVDCLRHPGTQWLIIACAERQAMESLQKVKDWAEAFGGAAEGNLSQVRFQNGSRIIALPARPASIRGYSANLILTEFAFHDDPEAVWRAAFPVITNPGEGGEKKVRIISTPNGQTNLFHRLWSGSAAYSKHFVNIHQAIAQGLPLNADELQSGLGDPEAWKQEYECQFIDTSAVLLPFDLLHACHSPHATYQSDPQTLSECRGPLYMGVAFEPSGKRAVCWILEQVAKLLDCGVEHRFSTEVPFPVPAGLRLVSPSESPRCGTGNGTGTTATEETNGYPALRPQSSLRAPCNSSSPSRTTTRFVTREILLLEGLSIPAQMEALLPRLRLARRGWLDSTGAGSAAGQFLARVSKLHQEPLTPTRQTELYPRLQAALQSGRVLLPGQPAVLDELHAMQAIVSENRQVRYHSPRNSCPEYITALALAVHGALEHDRHPSACATSVGTPFRSAERW